MAFKSQHGLPRWIEDSKDAITNETRTKEWRPFIDELYEAVQQQLKENHKQSFSDVKGANRDLLVARAIRAVEPGKAYVELFGKATVMLDQHCNNEVARQLLEEYPINTKSDLVLDCVEDGAMALLKKWPEMKSKLIVFLNKPLRTELRRLAWRLFLENQDVRKKYVEILTKNPRLAISSKDLEISQQCEKILSSEAVFNEIRGSTGAFYAMKAVLSYHHALLKTKGPLPDCDYLLAVPFIYVSLRNIPRHEPAPGTTVALLVEEYLTFMNQREAFLKPDAENNDAYLSLVQKVKSHVEAKRPETAKALAKHTGSQPGKIVATEQSRLEMLSEGISTLLKPVIKNLFVGYLDMEVLLYVWDRYIIGKNISGFNAEFVPMVAATLLLLITMDMENSPEGDLPANLQRFSCSLKLSDFLFELQKNFGQNLKTLMPDETGRRPVFDPTQMEVPGWLNWFQDVIPHRTDVRDRRLAREQREAERQRLLQHQQQELEKQKQEMQLTHREEASALRRGQEELGAQFFEERADLVKRLEDEKMRHLAAERAAMDQIESLRREVDVLRGGTVRTPQVPRTAFESRISHYLLGAPPNTAATHVSPTPTVYRPEKPPKQALEFVKQFLGQVRTSFNKVSQGEGLNRKRLDDSTLEGIKQHKDDMKAAELEIFGRNLAPGDWEKMSESMQEGKSKEMMSIINKKMAARRKAAIDRGYF